MTRRGSIMTICIAELAVGALTLRRRAFPGSRFHRSVRHDAADVCAGHWLRLQSGLATRQASRPYSHAQHRAQLLRRKADA
jgi:hypothetical protein